MTAKNRARGWRGEESPKKRGPRLLGVNRDWETDFRNQRPSASVEFEEEGGGTRYCVGVRHSGSHDHLDAVKGEERSREEMRTSPINNGEQGRKGGEICGMLSLQYLCVLGFRMKDGVGVRTSEMRGARGKEIRYSCIACFFLGKSSNFVARLRLCHSGLLPSVVLRCLW